MVYHFVVVVALRKLFEKKKRLLGDHHLLRISESIIPAEVRKCSRCTLAVTLPPHELIQVRVQHCLVYTLHPLELPLHSTLVGLDVLGVHPAGGI